MTVHLKERSTSPPAETNTLIMYNLEGNLYVRFPDGTVKAVAFE